MYSSILSSSNSRRFDPHPYHIFSVAVVSLVGILLLAWPISAGRSLAPLFDYYIVAVAVVVVVAVVSPIFLLASRVCFGTLRLLAERCRLIAELRHNLLLSPLLGCGN